MGYRFDCWFWDFEGEYDIQGDEIGAVEINDEDAYIIQKIAVNGMVLSKTKILSTSSRAE